MMTSDVPKSTVHTAVRDAAPGQRDTREVVRDEQLMRRRVLEALAEGPLTVPELADRLGQPAHEVTVWVMGLRKYGWLAEIKEVGEDGYYQYRAIEREGT